MNRGWLRDGIALAALAVLCLAAVRADLTRLAASSPDARTTDPLAWESLNRRAFAERDIPLWNPYEFGGRPHLANADTRVFYPPHLVLRALPLPADAWLPASLALHAWLAGIGGYLASRHFSLGRIAATTVGLALMFGGALSPAGEPGDLANRYWLAWLPLVVAFALRSASRPGVRGHGLLVSSLVAAVLGTPDRAIVTLAVAAVTYAVAWLLATTAERRAVHLASQFAMVTGLVLGLSAIQLVPSLGYWREAAALNAPEAEPQGTDSSPIALPDTLVARDGDGGRVLSTCGTLDRTRLVEQGIPNAGGEGGRVPSAVTRFGSLAREHARDDLIQFLGVRYLVSCDQPDGDRWEDLAAAGDARAYRHRAPWPRAFWTCAPERVGADELAHRLRRGRYDTGARLHRAPKIHVRWAASVGDDSRPHQEKRLHIAPERFLGDRTWEYALLDTSSANIEALIVSPEVEDTHRIDRSLRVVVPEADPVFDEPKTEWLVGAAPCGGVRPATMLAHDRFDGVTSLTVDAPEDGIVFVSEAYDSGRAARVDGERVEVLRVNFAFVAVPVTRGIHRIELRPGRMLFGIGAGLSSLTLAAWVMLTWRADADRA